VVAGFFDASIRDVINLGIGSRMPAITHFSGIAISNGCIYVTTIDAKLYSFGLEGQ
jgi:hypothetical protein